MDEISRRLSERPYEIALLQLTKIADCYTPIEKMSCIADVSKYIVESINKFWDGLRIKKDKLTIDGDSLLMIYIYICFKAKILDLFAQIKIMNEFSTPFVRTTKLGYCLSTLEVALNHILSMEQEDLVLDEESDNLWSNSRRSKSK